jgi:predicted ATP-grasp superfamily ATP-dependent carboligase
MRDTLAADLAVLPAVVATVALQPGEPAPPAPLQGVVASPALALTAWLDDAQQGFDAVWLVAPESDGLLASMQAVVTPSRWIGCDAAAVAVSSSKRATLAAMARAGVTTPLDFAPEATAWVVKPDDGAGAIDTRRHASRDAAFADLHQRTAAGAAAVLEPWVEGEPLSLALLRVDGGTRVIARNRQCIELDDEGALHYRGVEVGAIAASDPRAPGLDALARRVTAALPGLRGVVGIDLVWHPRLGPVLIEINPRPTCAYAGLSAAAGFNVAAAVLADHLARSFVRAPEAADAGA